MKCLFILMAALTSAASVVAGASKPDGMSPGAGSACAAAGCLAASMSVQLPALTAANPELGDAARTVLVAAFTPGGGQGAVGTAGVSAGGMTGGSGTGTPGIGGGATPGASSGGGSPGGVNSGGSGIGSSGAMSQSTSPGGDNRNLSNRQHIDRGPGGAPNGARPPVSESDAARSVQQSTDGRILDVKPDNAQGRLTYRVKVLSDSGEVRVITIDARTGSSE